MRPRKLPLVSLDCDHVDLVFISRYLHRSDEYVGQEFGIESIFVSYCSLSSIDQSCLSGLWLLAIKQSVWTSEMA